MENNKKLFIALFFTMLMVMLSFSVLGNVATPAANGNNNSVNILKENSATSTHTPWTFPTNTTEEPGYTGGTYIGALAGAPGDLNIYSSSVTVIDGCVEEEIYNGLYQTFLNGSTGPSLATRYTLTLVPSTSNHTTFDVETGKYENFSAIYTVHLRKGVRWTDWTAANATQTYVFSNVTDYNNGTGVAMPHTFKKYQTLTMLKYEVQAGDVVCSWRIGDTYGRYPGVVNAVPVNNLTVAFYVTTPTLLMICDDFEQDITPYNIWHHHNYASIPGYFNYSSALTPDQASSSYNSWDLNWNEVTGSVPGLVGTGPFMVTNGFGVTQGEVIPNHVIKEYANPYFFYQYANASSGLRQWTPKIHAMQWDEFVTVSSMLLAATEGQIDGLAGIGTSDVPSFEAVPNMELLTTPSSVYNMLDINTHSSVAPLNVTNFRQALNYAVPKSYIARVLCDGNIPGLTWMDPSNTLFYNSSVPSFSFSLSKASALLNSTPGFSHVNGKLDYLGKPVTLTVDILSSAIAATDDLGMYIIKSDWESLGITVHFNLVSVGTLFSALGAVQDGQSNNAFEIENFCDSNGIGDSALCCEIRYDPTYGLPACSYAGPFGNVTIDGKHYTGNQIQSLMDNLSVQAVTTNNIVVAEHDVKEMQGIEVYESIIIPLGYSISHIPLLLTNFKNQTSVGQGFCYWNRLSVEKRSTPLSVSKVKALTIKQSISQNAFSSGQYGNITITTLSGTTPVSGVNLTIGYTAPYSGVINVSSTQLVTNSQGQAVFEFRTTRTLKDLLGLASKSYEMVNFTIIATQRNYKVSPAAVVATNTSHLSVIATAFNVTSTSSPPPVKPTSVLDYEIGLIVASLVAVVSLGYVGFTKFKVKKT